MADKHIPATKEYNRIRSTFLSFKDSPFTLTLKYRYYKFLEFLGYKSAPIDTKLYPILRTMRNLGGKDYVRKNLYEGKGFNQGLNNYDEAKAKLEAEAKVEAEAKLEAEAKAKINDLFTEIKDQFNYLYNGDNSFIVSKLQREYDEHEEIRKKLLRLMPQFKTRINQFSRKHQLSEIIEFTDNDGDTNDQPHKKTLEEMELPRFRWSLSVPSDKDNLTDKEKRHNAKRNMSPVGKIIAMLVALGQAVIGAYAVFEVVARLTFLADPLWAPLFASIALVATLVTNYILFRNRTVKTMVQFFIDRKFFGSFKDNGSRIAALMGFVMSLSAGLIMGAIAWIGCTALLPGTVGLSFGIGLMVFNIVSYTSVMYVSTINLIKKIREKLSLEYWFGKKNGVFHKLKERWENDKIATTVSWVLHTLLFAAGIAILIFSLTSLLSSWHHLIVQFLTDTLPAFMHVSTSIANIISITLVLGLAGAARAAFNFESIFTVVDFCTECLMDNFIVRGVKSFLGIENKKKAPVVLKEEKFELKDLWKDPLNTSLKWAEYGIKGILVVLNSIAFSCLAVMGYHRLEILGVNNEFAAKGLSLLSTAVPSTGANAGAIRDALEPEPGIVFDSPIGAKSSSRCGSQAALLAKEEESESDDYKSGPGKGSAENLQKTA